MATSPLLTLDQDGQWTVALDVPDRPGVWGFMYEGEWTEVDIYPLEPVGGELCFWSQDLGFVPSRNEVWTSDEWLGHIPVKLWDDVGGWTFLREL